MVTENSTSTNDTARATTFRRLPKILPSLFATSVRYRHSSPKSASTSAMLKAKKGSSVFSDDGASSCDDGASSSCAESNTPRHIWSVMTMARPMACSNEGESATAASTAFQSTPLRRERPLPRRVDAFLAMTSSTKLRTRSKDPMSYGAFADAHLPGSVTRGWNDESGGIVGGQFPGALLSVGGIVRVSKALFTILGACGATRTASVTGGLVQALSGTPDEGSILVIRRSLGGFNMAFRAPSSLTSSLFTVVKPAIAVCSSRAVPFDPNAASCACRRIS